MNKILSHLYNGEIFPAEQYIPKRDSIRIKHLLHYADFIEKLKNLSPDLEIELDELESEASQLEDEVHSQMFIKGFRLGARMAIEIFSDEN